jgi:hypothetical protein
MLAHHAHRSLANFLGIRLLCHGSIFSRLGASDEAGAVHSDEAGAVHSFKTHAAYQSCIHELLLVGGEFSSREK